MNCHRRHLFRHLMPVCCFAVAVLTVSLNICFGQLPTQMQKSIDDAKTVLAEKYDVAKETLLIGFDKKISQARTAPKLSPADRQQLIGSVEAEKAIFEKFGTIPFSPTMRTEAIAYLNAIQKAEIALAKAFDKGVEYYIKQASDDAARSLLDDKRTSLSPKVVSRWDLTGPKGGPAGTWSLQSDGTKRGGTWTLDQKHLIVRDSDKMAPGGANIYTAVVSPDGMKLDFTSNRGAKYTATLGISNE